jgi:hypothetical protein
MHPHPTIFPCQPPATNADGAMAVMPSAGCEVDTPHLESGVAPMFPPPLTFAEWQKREDDIQALRRLARRGQA